MSDGMPTTLRDAASRDEGKVNGEDVSGTSVGAIEVKSGAAEAERLAAAQAERLAKRAAEPVPAPVPEPPKAPQLVGALSVQLFDSGQVQLSMPPDNPDLVLELLRCVQVALINTAREQGRQLGAKQPKVPFMARVFGKRPQSRA